MNDPVFWIPLVGSPELTGLGDQPHIDPPRLVPDPGHHVDAVVGGGLAGLTLANALEKGNGDLLLEACGRVDPRGRSIQPDYG